LHLLLWRWCGQMLASPPAASASLRTRRLTVPPPAGSLRSARSPVFKSENMIVAPTVAGPTEHVFFWGAHGMPNGSLAPLSLLCALILGKHLRCLVSSVGRVCFPPETNRRTVFRNNS
jgi:hypothetical protein